MGRSPALLVTFKLFVTPEMSRTGGSGRFLKSAARAFSSGSSELLPTGVSFFRLVFQPNSSQVLAKPLVSRIISEGSI